MLTRSAGKTEGATCYAVSQSVEAAKLSVLVSALEREGLRVIREARIVLLTALLLESSPE